MSDTKFNIGGKINLTKINKEVLFKSEKTGDIYLDIIIFFDPTEEDQYENHGAIIQSFPKDKRPEKALYLGNVRHMVPKADVADQSVTQEDIDDLPF